ncbi:hypothetical protein ACWC0C_09505 [Streptomyces sp. NPDC001709]
MGGWCEEFVALEGTLRGGPSQHDTAVLAAMADCMRSAMSGYLRWSRTCLRYAHLVPPVEPALVADLLTGR